MSGLRVSGSGFRRVHPRPHTLNPKASGVGVALIVLGFPPPRARGQREVERDRC